ncbi:unnamed protein product [Miscanthus lutarioriparius]|uniref:Uncharacterized protein n=1 Tax=Miscanthus lutarioriparius TaxID=422564 RepID=A0A811MZS1_9POAL|nr:unnamed protein product [Miscanthus lutarioriparius]
MGRGRNRKPRNFATFRLCPRPGAADASDRVFVRVDENPYSVPGFADDEAPSSSTAVGGDGGEPAPSSTSTDDGGAALPEQVRLEILELGLPDDGYDYLAHLRELRPSLSSTGGGGSSAVFLPSRRPARFGPRVDVKAYDFTRTPLGSGDVAVVAASRAEEAIDLDVARLLDGSHSPTVESGDEDLEEDFVILANEPDEEQENEEENVAGGEEKALQLPREQFDSLALEDADSGDDCHVRDAKHELSQEVTSELKSTHSENFDADKKCRAPAPQYVAHGILESKEQIDVSSNAISECAGYAEIYDVSGEEQVILASESSEGSAVMYSTTMVSGSYLDVKKKIPKLSPGETSMKKAIIRKGIEKLPAGYLPQRNTSSDETLKPGPYKEPKEEGTES